MTEEKRCVNHPDRPIRARNLCGSCYVMAQRKERFGPWVSYVDELIEEVEAVGLTWDQAEEMFGRKRTTISNALYRRPGGKKIVEAIQAKTYGTVGRGNINSALPKTMPRGSYREALVEELEYHPEWKWEDACAKFDRKRGDLYAVLKRDGQEGLIARLNKNSGTKDISPYLEDIVRYSEFDSDLTWDVLCGLLGKKPKTVRQYLLRRDRRDLVKRLDEATRKGHVGL